MTPIRIFFILILAGTAYTFVIKRTWNKWLMRSIQKNLSDHIIVAGFGISGSEAVDELIARGHRSASRSSSSTPTTAALERAEALGCAVLQGDATRDRTLEAVRVEQRRP